MNPPECIVAVAGPSCAGKSTLAAALAERAPRGGVVVGLDAYYRDFSGVDPDALDVDVPEALDVELLVEQVSALAAGRAIDQPVYDYATHARTGRTRRVEPAPWVIVEGLFALHWPALRELAHVRVFVDAPDAVCRARRESRDVRERGRTPGSVRRAWDERVRPRAAQYVAPTRRHAHVVLDGTRPTERLVEVVVERITRRAGR